MHLTWLGVPTHELSATQMHDLLQLRHDVFVIEQDCPDYRDIDGLDVVEGTHHVIGVVEGRVLATARVLAPGVDGPRTRIGRVAVHPSARGGGSGHDLMEQALSICDQEWPASEVLLSAQAHLEDYYRRHGFRPVGEVYLEDDIPHVDMVRAVE